MNVEAVPPSCTKRAASLWLTLCLALGGKSAIDQYGDEIVQAISKYRRERRVGFKSKARARKINRVVLLCDELMNEVAESRDWLDANIEIIDQDGVDIEAIIQGEASPLRALRDRVKAALEEAPDQSGKEAVYFRRRFWCRLALIYEDATERRAATSKNKDGSIQGDFVRMIAAVTEYISPGERVTSDMVDQFIDWYRSSDSADIRDEISEYRMLSAAMGFAG
ncbi:hypothetical protein [Methylobacterium sp. E-046]|uniref:hypothetical protein n=1 Tax=Methylobacterium sp. E-046 TaxID=2836576 RepID=UPI001FBB948B|nr:hypothetical protein [Methylobacterium sp. E-046]MCJ2102757.1 hypothetical protein [Methylobacterium sp. E-046]